MGNRPQVIRIGDLSDARLDAYTRLTERELRSVLEPERGIFIAESAKVIEGYRYVDMWAENISKEELAKTIGQPVHTVPQVLIDQTPIGGFTEFDRYVRDHALLA